MGAGKDPQVGSAQRGRQVGLGCAEALALAMRHLVRAHAFLTYTVEVRVHRVSRLAARLNKDGTQGIGTGQIHHMQRPVHTVEIICPAAVVFRFFEVGKHVHVGPARVALLGPGVIVLALAAHVDHGVDRTRAAQHLAPWLVATPTIEPGLHRGLKLPVGVAISGQYR